MSSMVVMIMVEILSVLAVATKQMNRERFGKSQVAQCAQIFP
jgi:hypothetical protein